MSISRNCSARRDVVTMATLAGRVSVPSAGERSTRRPSTSKSRKIGSLLSGKGAFLPASVGPRVGRWVGCWCPKECCRAAWWGRTPAFCPQKEEDPIEERAL